MSCHLTVPHQDITSIVVTEQFQWSWPCTLDDSDSVSHEYMMHGSGTYCASTSCQSHHETCRPPSGNGLAGAGVSQVLAGALAHDRL